MKKINEDDLIIIEVKANEGKNMLEVITEDNAIHYFPTYAFNFLLELMQEGRDTWDLMTYVDLLNEHMLASKIENMKLDDEEIT